MNTAEPRLIPLGGEAHATARKFAAEQPFPAKAKRVFHNTLAVYAVYTYLRWLQVETNLNLSSSWNFATRTVTDSADLVLPGKGKLECRPVLPGDTKVYVPPEAEIERIGYVAVLLNEPIYNEAQLLGFASSISLNNRQEVNLSAFEPFDVLLDVLFPEANQVQTNPQIASTTISTPPRLSQWLSNIFTDDWQPFESLLSNEAVNFYAARSRELLNEQPSGASEEIGVKRGKLINLEMKLSGQQLVLVAVIRPTASPVELDITIRIYPANGRYILPEYLKLTILEENGETFREVVARETDSWIQAAFFGELGEKFFAKVTYEQESLTEEFMI